MTIRDLSCFLHSQAQALVSESLDSYPGFVSRNSATQQIHPLLSLFP